VRREAGLIRAIERLTLAREALHAAASDLAVEGKPLDKVTRELRAEVARVDLVAGRVERAAADLDTPAEARRS
jgi:hypothetical protein